ncbi:MAG: response regulator transcription factor [Candidatus Promineifilaceae bacterium]
MNAEPTLTTDTGRILVVDDEANIRAGLRAILTRDGHEVKDAASGEEALPILEVFPCEVAIVDIRMPGMSGVELLHVIRTRRPYVSVVLLTGHGTLETAMAAIREGAHDYLLKPAQPDAIRATVASALATARREREQAQLMDSLRSGLQRLGELPAGPSPAPTPGYKRRAIDVGDLHIDLQAYEVRRGAEPVSLTPSEFQLLVALASRPGEVIDYISLVRLALDYDAESWEAKELIKRHVFALRRKIEPDPSSPQYILNVRGIGYRLAAGPDS